MFSIKMMVRKSPNGWAGGFSFFIKAERHLLAAFNFELEREEHSLAGKPKGLETIKGVGLEFLGGGTTSLAAGTGWASFKGG